MDFDYFGLGNNERTGRTDSDYTAYRDAALGLALQTDDTGTSAFTRKPDGGLTGARFWGTLATTGTSQYYLTDNLGSVIAILDDTGTQTAAYSYDPYGNTRTATGDAATANPYRYAGGYLDLSTGLYKLGYRYNDPTTGRFTQPDPSGQEANPYLYAVGNPCNNVDPSGLSSLGCGGAIFGLIGGVALLIGGIVGGFAAGLPTLGASVAFGFTVAGAGLALIGLGLTALDQC